MSSIANALYGGGDEPDFSGAPSQSQSQQPTQSQPNQPQRGSIWRNVLVGALHGLASSGGARTFGEGLATGAAGEQAAQERDKANQRAQATADAQQAMYHASTNAALLKLAQANPSSPEHAQEIADYNASQNDSMIKAGGAKVVASFDNIEDAQRAALAGNGRVGTFHDSDGDLKYGLLQFSTDKVPDKTDVKYIGADGTEQTMSVGPNTISYADLDDLNHKYLLNKIDSSYKAHLENVKSQNKIDVANETGVTQKNQATAAKTNAQAKTVGQPKVDNMLVGSLSDGTQVAGTADQLKTAGASGITKLPAADASKVIVARQLVAPNGLFAQVAGAVRDLDQKGKLGVVASRWGEFAAGKLGSDPDFAALRTPMGLLSTALLQAHVGAKGGEGFMEHFADLANQGKLDGPTLKTALNAEYRYVREKSMLPKAGQ